ncbi:MAG TPA: molybdenum cofactor guanylyltransferase [Roseiflexaceae bacterium]|mgnify:CR=1 FL=1|nr:molybdenum cofactor guanylyltransferase [Roseiflexaceae bacterium]HMP38800.1 molybdenum cofactor guanylyltransferase [Roseiflexaceae bacterium]
MTSCIIVAGGASSRMGRDKRRLRLWGPTGPMLLERIVALGMAHCHECVVVLNDPQAWQQLPVRLVPDAYPGSGPLGGLASGLAAIEQPYAMVLACDMPSIQPALLTFLIEYPCPADALVPLRRTDHPIAGMPAAEPLMARYRRDILPAIEARLAAGMRSMIGLLETIDTRFITAEAWQPYDPAGVSFFNLNQPHDLAHWQAAHHAIGG